MSLPKAIRIASLLVLIASMCSAQSGGLLERALNGKARVIDLTHKLNAGAPAYGGERDAFRYEKLSQIERDGYASGAFRVPEHFGTHVDAPGHFLGGKETVDMIDPKRLIARAVVIDVRRQVSRDPDYRLTVADIQAWERTGPIPSGAMVLMLTGWGSRYGDVERYRNADKNGDMHFPGFSEASINYLVTTRRAVALGIDTLSIDYGASKDFGGHKLSHAAGLYHVENMANLDRLPARGAVVFTGPLAIENGSGSPARVLAIAP